MPTFEIRIMRKREAFIGQATHTADAALYKFVNGSLFVLKERTLLGHFVAYPVWSKCANHQKPASLKPINKETN